MKAKKSPIKSFFARIVVLLIILATVAGLYFITPKAAPPPPVSKISLTQTPDYNACQIISTEAIKTTYFADLVTGISEGVRAGMNAPNGTIADSCGFGFTTAKSLDNNLFVEVYPYTATINGANKEMVDASWSEVATSNPKAYFGKDIDGDTIIYKLRVIPGGKNVMFEIRQPLLERAIDEPSALDFLVGLAAKAKYDVVDPPITD
ncbi:MAG: hypothetical protein JWN28_706 [Candidatus Saccharibacteria bacterium]|nr:hypothetical protein [Candidatus Saccharibacteria bacterium]